MTPCRTSVHDLDVLSNGHREVVDLRSLADEVRDVSRRPRLVAVDGRAGAGKSHFARSLIPLCGDVALVRVDDFLWWSDIEGWWERLRREALEPLLDGRQAQFRSGTGSRTRSVGTSATASCWSRPRPSSSKASAPPAGTLPSGSIRRTGWRRDLKPGFGEVSGETARSGAGTGWSGWTSRRRSSPPTALRPGRTT